MRCVLLVIAACGSPTSPQPIANTANTQPVAPAVAACDRIAAKVGALPGYFPDCCNEAQRRVVIARHCVQHGWIESAIDPCSKANDFFMCLETVGLGDAQRAAWNDLVRDIACDVVCK